jgi:trans-2,3-dihydro-3-hydroxyanthranilate isomerase
MISLEYRIVDVFTAKPLEGNALAVFTDASQIDEALMQKIAREMNLAETTFVLPSDNPGCDARVRIFTPRKEMLFAGHPTIGTAFVVRKEGLVPNDCVELWLEEKVGPVQIFVDDEVCPMFWLRTPPISEGRIFDRSLCAQALGLETHELLDVPPQILDAGNPTLLIALKDEAVVDRAWLDSAGMKILRNTAPSEPSDPFCVFVFCRTRQGSYSRMFAPEYGIPEDPATGSSTGPLTAFMMKHGLFAPTAGTSFVSEQGTKMGRRSLLHVKVLGEKGSDGILVGGHVTAIAEGIVTL